MRTLCVLHVIGGGDTGGAMSHLLPLLSALKRAGCDAHLLCLGEGGLAEEAKSRGLSVTVLPMSGSHDPRVFGPLRRILRTGPAGMAAAAGMAGGAVTAAEALAAKAPAWAWDVVHTHGMRANLPVRMVVRSARKCPCLFTTVHSDLLLDYESARVARLYQRLDRLTLGTVDKVVCVSDALRELLVTQGYPRERLLTVRSGLEGAGVAVGEGETRSVFAEKAVDHLRVGTVARLVAVKDIDLMLEVVALLRQKHPGVELIIVGDGPERRRLEMLASERGLTDVVRFVGSLDDPGPVLRKLDIYLVTSVFEGGVSMAVLEAMAAALPVVTTAAGGVAEAVVDGETGYVVSRECERGALAAALAERAAALLDDPALRERMGAAGAQRARAHFSVEETAARTLRAYERCLAARSGLS